MDLKLSSQTLLPHLDIESSFVRAFSYIFGVAGLTLATGSAFKSGIAFDSSYELGVGNLSYQLNRSSSLSDAYQFMPNASEFYGVFVQKSANVLNQFFTSDSGLLDGFQHSAYMWQYLVVLVLLLISIFAITKAIEIFTSGVRVFHLTFLFFCTNPLILGHLQINYKDAPVAFALLIYVSGLILFNSAMLGINHPITTSKPSIFRYLHRVSGLSDSSGCIGILFMFFGFLVSISCRAGSIAILFGLGLSGIFSFMLLFFLKMGNFTTSTLIRYFLSQSLTISFALYVFGFVNTLAKIDLKQLLFDSVIYASNNPAVGLVRTAGVDVFNDPVPSWYIPAWIFISMPLATLFGLTFGSYYLLRHITFSRVVLILPLITLGILAPVVLLVINVSLIDGIRQILFIPIGFISVGLAGLLIWGSIGKKPIAVIALLSISFFSFMQTISWVPYAYTYKNEFSRFGKLQPAWENDYLGVSVREGVERLRNTHGLSTVIVTPTNDSAHPWNDTPYLVEKDKLIKWPDDPFPNTFGVYIFHRHTWTNNTNFPIDSCEDFPLQPNCKKLKSYDCKVLFTIVHNKWEFGRGAICRSDINSE